MRGRCWRASNKLDERAPDYRDVLAELAALLQKLALLQAVPDLQLDEAEDIETLPAARRRTSLRKMRSCSTRSPSSADATWSLRRMPAAVSRWCSCGCWRSAGGGACKVSARCQRRRSTALQPPRSPTTSAAPTRPPQPHRATLQMIGSAMRRADEPAGHGDNSLPPTDPTLTGRQGDKVRLPRRRTASISAGRSSKRSWRRR